METEQQTTEHSPEAIAASRKKLITLISIAFVPIFIAYAAFFYFPAMAPDGTTNRGELITPPLAGEQISESLTALNSWVLLQPVSANCDKDCEQMLYLSRQVTAGLGKDSGRIKRILLTDSDLPGPLQALLKAEHADMEVVQGSLGSLRSVTSVQPTLFLMDPNANVMMYFSLDQAGKPMLKDLKHLLKISNIG